jgi:hypothetical protein
MKLLAYIIIIINSHFSYCSEAENKVLTAKESVEKFCTAVSMGNKDEIRAWLPQPNNSSEEQKEADWERDCAKEKDMKWSIADSKQIDNYFAAKISTVSGEWKLQGALFLMKDNTGWKVVAGSCGWLEFGENVPSGYPEELSRWAMKEVEDNGKK